MLASYCNAPQLSNPSSPLRHTVARARARKRPNPDEGPGEAAGTSAAGVDAMEVDGEGVAPEPHPQPHAPGPALPAARPPAEPSEPGPAVPSEPAPAVPPSQHAAQPMGIVEFCTLLLHSLVGIAVDKAQGKRWEHASMHGAICKQGHASQAVRAWGCPHLQGPVLTPFPFPCRETIDLTQYDEGKRTKKVVREATRKKWVEKFGWIVWTNETADSGNHRAKCRVCLDYNPNTSEFGNVHGLGAAVKDANDLQRHADSKHHQYACDKSLKKSGGKGSIQSGMSGLMKRAAAETLEVVPMMLYCALWLMIEGMPGSKFPGLLVLAKILGAKGLIHKYNHHRYFWSCMYAISELTMCSVLDAASKSPYYALLCDGSTDITCQNHVMVYIRYLDMLSFKYVTEFLCCARVSADSSDHHTAIMSGIVEALHLDTSKLVSMCTDGAPTYTGVHNGTVKQLREKYNPFLVGVHCSAHKTALSMNDVASQKGALQDCMDHVDSLLKGAHALFAKSYKRNEEWIAFSKARGVIEFKFPLFSRTRWGSIVSVFLPKICMS